MKDKKIEFYTLADMKNRAQYDSSYIVQDIIKGNKVSLISGGSKVGKSTLALDMAYSISKGTPFLNKETIQSDVLYISLDNEDDLIAERINKMEMEENNHLIFCYDKEITEIRKDDDDTILDLFEVITQAIGIMPKLRIVFIDLLDNIRNMNFKNEYSNAKATEDITSLKLLADYFQIHIIGLGHDTKAGTNNGYNSTKGGVELVGTLNGTFMHLKRDGICETVALLEIGGRNVPELKTYLILDTNKLVYQILEDQSIEDIPYEIGTIRNFLIKHGDFEGTLSELLSLSRLTCSASTFGKLLTKYKIQLESEGIYFNKKAGRTKGRIYVFNIDHEDTKDGKYG